MNIVLLVVYVLFAVGGSTLIKYGGIAKISTLFIIPFVNTMVTWVSLLGIVCYGVSFIVYIILLSKFDLSVLSPVTIGFVYVLLMVTSVLVFHEQFTIMKIIGCVLVLVGVMLVVINK